MDSERELTAAKAELRDLEAHGLYETWQALTQVVVKATGRTIKKNSTLSLVDSTLSPVNSLRFGVNSLRFG
eukprot:65004-Prorocentrum_minimum.AAC.1